jgi:hypothetical protein
VSCHRAGGAGWSSLKEGPLKEGPLKEGPLKKWAPEKDEAGLAASLGAAARSCMERPATDDAHPPNPAGERETCQPAR